MLSYVYHMLSCWLVLLSYVLLFVTAIVFTNRWWREHRTTGMPSVDQLTIDVASGYVKIAIEIDIEIVDLPIDHGDFL